MLPLAALTSMVTLPHVWALGLLVGIYMVFGGVALIAMALHARNVDPRPAEPAH